MSRSLEFRLLGPMECIVDGARISLGRTQERLVLALLLLERDHVVPVERLAELVWDGTPPAHARSIVHTHVSRVRATLRTVGIIGDGVELTTYGHGYRIDIAADVVDAHRFRQLVDQARRAADPARRVATLTEALGLWRGPALTDVVGTRTRDQICAGLEELRLVAQEDLAELELDLGAHRDLITRLTDLVVRHPLRERLVGLLMIAQYRSGQQARALATYRDTRQRLVDELGIEPGVDLRRIERAILVQDPELSPPTGVSRPTPVTTGTTATGVPRPPVTARQSWLGPRCHLTTLVGRDTELTELAELLADHRLVTVVGPGGIGKTTLALRTAELTGVGLRDGVIVAPVATARTEADVILALGALLDLPSTTVTECLAATEQFLATHPRLLVLDNCEHLSAACARVVRRLLSASVNLVVLVTSREPLGLPEETVWRLDPLRLPAPGSLPTADTPAIALLLRRAGAALPKAADDSSELDQVARICHRLDGLPLALELAAARLRNIPLGRLADQLEESIDVLDGGADSRHQTLTATVDWSYRLLSEPERRLLARLSVFRGSFTAEAAAAVCAAAPLSSVTVPAILAELVDRSLVQPYDQDGTERHRLLEVVRVYAAARLRDLDEPATTADQHLTYWLDTARTISQLPQYDHQVSAWSRLGPDLDNLRAAAGHGYAGGDGAAALELATLTFDFWLVHDNRLAEAERWLEEAWPHLADAAPQVRCLTRYHRAWLLANRGDQVGAAELLDGVHDDLARHHPQIYNDARASALRFRLRALDPAALPQAEAVSAALRESDEMYLRLTGFVLAVEARQIWGRYDEAAQLCQPYEPPPGGSPFFSSRYHTLRCLVAVGQDDRESAAKAEANIREHLAAPDNFLHLAVPGWALALRALCALPPRRASVVAADIVRLLRERYAPAVSRAHGVLIFQAEAQRRGGDHAAALALLTEALELGLGHNDYTLTMPGVLAAALLAADRGDLAAARDLAERWDRLRSGIGLPAPLGFAQQVAEVFGLRPEAPPNPDPAYRWSEQPLRDLVERALAWCRDAT